MCDKDNRIGYFLKIILFGTLVQENYNIDLNSDIYSERRQNKKARARF